MINYADTQALIDIFASRAPECVQMVREAVKTVNVAAPRKTVADFKYTYYLESCEKIEKTYQGKRYDAVKLGLLNKFGKVEYLETSSKWIVNDAPGLVGFFVFFQTSEFNDHTTYHIRQSKFEFDVDLPEGAGREKAPTEEIKF